MQHFCYILDCWWLAFSKAGYLYIFCIIKFMGVNSVSKLIPLCHYCKVKSSQNKKSPLFIESLFYSPNYSHYGYFTHCPSLMAQMVKNLPAMWETQIPSLCGEDPLEKEMATPSRYSWLENYISKGYSPWGHKVRQDWETNTFTLE